MDLTNRLSVPTLIHWHGQIPPNVQDGVLDAPMPMLTPGETRSYDFALLAGTHWMHAHIPTQEMQLLAAPLIVRSDAETAEDRQEVVIFLHEFSFKTPEEVLEEITSGGGTGHATMVHGAIPAIGRMDERNMGQIQGTGDMVMDWNDYDFDAYLANDRTLDDPEVIMVEPSGRLRLRIVNASAATVYWIDLGDLPAQLVAVDGHGVFPVSGRRIGVAMAQRLDLLVDLPGTGAWPILALREGARERTGLILAMPGAKVRKLDSRAATKAPAFDLTQELRLIATEPLITRASDRTHMLMLAGAMQPYRWTINGAIWGDHQPVIARSGDRVEIMFHNMSMTGHPMHLHGHPFQVVNINDKKVAGARRDTVYAPPMTTVTVALDAGEAARWMLHCHHMPHLGTGMMTEFAVTA